MLCCSGSGGFWGWRPWCPNYNMGWTWAIICKPCLTLLLVACPLDLYKYKLQINTQFYICIYIYTHLFFAILLRMTTVVGLSQFFGAKFFRSYSKHFSDGETRTSLNRCISAQASPDQHLSLRILCWEATTFPALNRCPWVCCAMFAKQYHQTARMTRQPRGSELIHTSPPWIDLII